MRKRIGIIFCVALMFISVSVQSFIFAIAPSGIIQPYWTNTSSVSCEVIFVKTTGYATAKVTGQSGTTLIEGTLTLYRKSGTAWLYVTQWSKSAKNGSTLSFNESFSGTSGTTYKIVLSANVTRDGTIEPISDNHEKACP